jgi:geranylgeranyl diphosphate synthase type II
LIKEDTSAKFRKIFEDQIYIIEQKIAEVFNNKEPRSLYDPCVYILEAGGKRLRPFLLLIAAKTAGAEFNDAYNAALAVELLHNFTLVHDDIMDNADRRRGRETLHIKYDDSTAILAGDNLLAFAYKYLLKDCRENDKSVINEFTQGLIEVCEGQSLDKEFEARQEVSIEEYKIMIYKKTAALAKACCIIGALIGRASEEETEALASFGKNIGMAFQIQDDLLDILADETEFGKIVGGDLVEGKKTYLFLKALEKAVGDDKKALLDVIKNKGILKDEINRYKELYVRLGVFEDARNEIITYTETPTKGMMVIKNEGDRELLLRPANILIKRSK